MMPRLSSSESTNTRKCHKCGKGITGNKKVASICRKFNDSTSKSVQLKQIPKERNNRIEKALRKG